jgi:hypothetical protein
MAHGDSGGKSPGKALAPAEAFKRFVAPPPDNPKDLVKYVLVELDVMREHHQNFRREMHTLTEIMFDYKGWELVYAAYPITGKLNRFIHIWKIPDESDILEVMREGALNDNPVNAAAANTIEEQFRDCYQKVQAMIQATTHTVMSSLPYDPEHVGYQSQTILVDAYGEKFVIDHRDLRSHFRDRDISQSLEDLRQKLPRRLSSGRLAGTHKAPDENAPDERRHHAKPRMTQKNLEQLQQHLNQGAIVATIALNGGKSKALLFNLAGLKARTVFQQLEPVEEQAAGKGPVLNRKEDGNADMPVKTLLIAAPWGAVYELGADELGNRRVVKQIRPADRDKVDAALGPLIDARAPIAAIPEERDQTIGDGCACYIINLNSFVAAAK